MYVWAAGNGGEYFDSCAVDGYVSSIYTIAVGSVNRDGSRTAYDELCAGKMIVTFSHNRESSESQVVRQLVSIVDSVDLVAGAGV